MSEQLITTDQEPDLIQKFELDAVPFSYTLAESVERANVLIAELGIHINPDPIVDMQRAIESSTEMSEGIKSLMLRLTQQVSDLKAEVAVLKGESVQTHQEVNYDLLFEENFDQVKELMSIYYDATAELDGKIYRGYEAAYRQLDPRSNMPDTPDDARDEILNSIHNEIFELVRNNQTKPEDQIKALATFVALRDRSMMSAIEKEGNTELVANTLTILKNPILLNLALEWNKRIDSAIQIYNLEKEDIIAKHYFNDKKSEEELSKVDSKVSKLSQYQMSIRYGGWSFEESFEGGNIVLTRLIDKLKSFNTISKIKTLDIDYAELSKFIFSLMTMPHEELASVRIVDRDLEERAERLSSDTAYSSQNNSQEFSQEA